MDSLQTPVDGQSTSNPQNINQPSLSAPTNNLQGSVDVQGQLLKMPTSGLKVSGCKNNCEVPVGAQIVPAKSSNHWGVGGSIILVIVLALLIWRFIKVIKKVSFIEKSKIEILPEDSLTDSAKSLAESVDRKKSVPKTKKTKRRKSNRKSKR